MIRWCVNWCEMMKKRSLDDTIGDYCGMKPAWMIQQCTNHDWYVKMTEWMIHQHESYKTLNESSDDGAMNVFMFLRSIAARKIAAE